MIGPLAVATLRAGQALLVPEWRFLLLGVFGVALLAIAVLVLLAVGQTRRTKAAAVAKGIRIEGVRASTSFTLGVTSEMLRQEIRSVVKEHKRFSRVEETARGVEIYIRGNVWTWGEIIEIKFSEIREGTQITATCRPRLSTTLIDYGQSGKDLTMVVELLTQRADMQGDGA